MNKCEKCGAECPGGTVYLDGQNVCSTCYGLMRLAFDLAESLKHIRETEEPDAETRKSG